MKQYNEIIAKLVAQATELVHDDAMALMEYPRKEGQGDRALACFRFAKEYKMSPQVIAKDWATKINDQVLPDEISKVEAQGGYINFYFNDDQLAQDVLTKIAQNPDSFEKIEPKQKQNVVIEFSSPNIAKPFSIGHLRSTNLGASLARIYEYQGYEVTKINHLGDWGTQFGKLITAYHHWGNAQMLDEDPIQSLFELYVKFHDEEQKDPGLTTQAREAFSRLEKGDKKAKELWEWFKTLTLKELDQLYQRLGVSFDHIWGESFYIEQIPHLLSTLQSKGLSEKDEGANIVNLKDFDLGVALLQKEDESSLYITRDLAAAIYRYKEFEFSKMIYVVGSEQSLHFQQLFKILQLADYPFFDRCQHVAFGQITFGDEKMSTRKGNVVFLKDVLDRAQKKAFTLIETKNPDLANNEEIAFDVALGAVLFADLSAKRIKNVKFDWDEILSFEGETGPYLQYTYVRTQSLLKKYDQSVTQDVDYTLLEHDTEKKLIRTLSQFSFSLQKVTLENEPFYLGKYVIDLAKDFNRFYQSCRIMEETNELQKARMLLVTCTSCVLNRAMHLLGIPTPNKM